jgi:hypothetical protein
LLAHGNTSFSAGFIDYKYGYRERGVTVFEACKIAKQLHSCKTGMASERSLMKIGSEVRGLRQIGLAP